MRLKKQDDHEPFNPRRSLNTIVMKNPAAVTGVLDLKSENDKTKHPKMIKQQENVLTVFCPDSPDHGDILPDSPVGKG